MECYPDPPKGWLKLQRRMTRAKTAREINEIVEEMKQVLTRYETEVSSLRSQTSLISAPTEKGVTPNDSESDSKTAL